jgi:hypothetical protein
MNLPPPTGSPILARIQNEGKLPVIIAIAAGVVFLIFISVEIYKKIQQTYAKQSYAERQRTRLTNRGDIHAVAKEYAFTHDEAQHLFEMCKKHKVPNARFFLKDHEQTVRLFKAAYLDSMGEVVKDLTQSLVFSMFEKINKSHLSYSVISSTALLRSGQKLLYIDPDGKKYMTSVIESNENELIIATPKDKSGNEIMLQGLSKINLMIQGKYEVAFTTSVRVIRYQVRQGDPVVVVTHATQFHPYLKHEYVYIPARIPCQLQAVTSKPDPQEADAVILRRKEERITRFC